jgi:hypothetical protein
MHSRFGSLKCATGELGPIIDDDPIQDPKPTDDGLDKLDCGLIVDPDQRGCLRPLLVNLLMVTYRYRNPLTALGNEHRMSSAHTTNGHEGGIICSVCAGVWICLA